MSDLFSTLGYADSWKRSLRVKGRAKTTIDSYLLTLRQLDEFCRAEGLPTDPRQHRREHVEKFIGHTLSTRAVNTAGLRFRNLQQFYRWMVDQEEIESHPMSRMTAPVAKEAPIPILSDEALTALLRASEGKSFVDRRDHAIIRLFIGTGARISEVTRLEVGDVDLDQSQLTTVVKGGKTAIKPFGPKTAEAIDRYLRVRAAHKHAGSERLWLGPKGPMTRSGVQQMIERRGLQAGLGAIHAHQFRHTYSHVFLKRGGSESDLMKLLDWTSPAMPRRYGAALADERAREAYRAMNPGDRV